MNRIKEFPSFEKNNEHQEYLKKFDCTFLLKYLSQEGSMFLRKLSSLKCPSFGMPLIINWEGFQASLSVPEKSQAKYLECRHSVLSVLKIMSWSNFILIISAILAEKHVIFVHPNRETVAHFMLNNKFVFHEHYSSFFMAVSDNLFLVSRVY